MRIMKTIARMKKTTQKKSVAFRRQSLLQQQQQSHPPSSTYIGSSPVPVAPTVPVEEEL